MQKSRQDVAVRFLSIEKPPPCLPYRCPVATGRLLIGLHRDGLYGGAGDGTRTRDTLPSKQGVAGSPFAWYESAFEAD